MPWLPEWGRHTYLMGVINVTPDSFSGDGLHRRWEDIAARAAAMEEGGADVLDIGGESTRPGYQPVEEGEELARVLPAIRRVRQCVSVPISIDTSKAAVARAALDEGASIVNDVSALADDDMIRVVAEAGASLVLVHRGATEVETDMLDLIVDGLRRQIQRAEEGGVPPQNVIVDPGLGIGKGWRRGPGATAIVAKPRENLEIVRRLPELTVLQKPVLVGPSRKGMIRRVLGEGDSAADRARSGLLEGTLALVALSIAGGADVVRVHDVKEMARTAAMMDAIVRGWEEAPVTQR